MRVLRVAVLSAVAAITLGAAPAATPAASSAGPTPAASFKVTISPQYATAGQPTTYQVTVVNTSAPATTLGSVKVTPPAGFSSPHPAPGTSRRGKTKVQNRTLSLQKVSLAPGRQTRLAITATAPAKCGRTLLHWRSRAFEGTTGSGTALALDAALSRLGVTVLCPAAAACGDGGPACSTSLVTTSSTYAVVSDAPSGTLHQTVNVGNRLTCGSYRFRDANWYDSVVVPATPSPPTTSTPVVDTVTYTIRDATTKGIGFCLGVGYDFTTASGAQAPAAKLPTGNPGFIGLLPRCSAAKPPCIARVAQQSDPNAKTGSDALLTIQIPETGDPWGHS
jgi:hypothetical protein